MAEITENYDAFGIELDFSRTIRCFKELGHHNIPIMTDFLRQVRALCDRAAEKWGHPVRIMIRLSTRGADAVYLYNLFGVPAAWRIASSPEEALKVPVRRYLTTMNNFRPKGYKEREAVYLPVTCSVATAAQVTFSTGTLDTEKTTLLCLGIKSGEGKTNEEAAAALTVTVNGTGCLKEKSGLSCLEKYHNQRYEEAIAKHYPWRIFTYRVPAECDLTGNAVTVRLTADEAVSVHYAELINGDIC